jgi:hypothetical protein
MGVPVRLHVRTGARAGGAASRADARFDRAAFSMRVVGMEHQTAAQAVRDGKSIGNDRAAGSGAVHTKASFFAPLALMQVHIDESSLRACANAIDLAGYHHEDTRARRCRAPSPSNTIKRNQAQSSAI